MNWIRAAVNVSLFVISIGIGILWEHHREVQAIPANAEEITTEPVCPPAPPAVIDGRRFYQQKGGSWTEVAPVTEFMSGRTVTIHMSPISFVGDMNHGVRIESSTVVDAEDYIRIANVLLREAKK